MASLSVYLYKFGLWDVDVCTYFCIFLLQVAAFKASEIKEIELMQELRLKNLEKHQKQEADAKYCVCRKGPSSFMLQCELCKDSFHSKFDKFADFLLLEVG